MKIEKRKMRECDNAELNLDQLSAENDELGNGVTVKASFMVMGALAAMIERRM
jgi:hypothetical protein